MWCDLLRLFPDKHDGELHLSIRNDQTDEEQFCEFSHDHFDTNHDPVE